eukprot:g6554.t1
MATVPEGQEKILSGNNFSLQCRYAPFLFGGSPVYEKQGAVSLVKGFFLNFTVLNIEVRLHMILLKVVTSSLAGKNLKTDRVLSSGSFPNFGSIHSFPIQSSAGLTATVSQWLRSQSPVGHFK